MGLLGVHGWSFAQFQGVVTSGKKSSESRESNRPIRQTRELIGGSSRTFFVNFLGRVFDHNSCLEESPGAPVKTGHTST